MSKQPITIEDVLNAVNITKWKTLDTIITELHIKSLSVHRRRLRILIEEFNLKFNDHQTNHYYIAHSSKGYKLTQDVAEINASINDFYTRSMDMLKKYYGTKKALKENCNIQFDLEKEGLL